MYLEMSPNCIIKSYEPIEEPNSNPSAKSKDTENEDDNEYITLMYSSVQNMDNMPAEIKQLLKGLQEKLPDTNELPPPPEWLDLEKVKRGQQFYRRYLFGIVYSHTISLLYLFSNPEGLKPLIFTEKSHTESLAYKRYLSTVLRVKSWCETEFWDPSTDSYKNLKAVRGLHLDVSKRMSKLSRTQIVDQTNLENMMKKSDSSVVCPLQSVLQKDSEYNKRNISTCPFRIKTKDRVFLSQLEMSLTQYGFIGLMVTFPEKFGAQNATIEELEDYIHLWRYLGYMLGIKDEYNFCTGDVDTVLQRSHKIIEVFVVPMMLNVSKEWEHMARYAFRGIEKFSPAKINFEATLKYFYWVLDVPSPNLDEYVGWKEKFLFNFGKLVMTKGQQIPGFGSFCSYIVKRSLDYQLRVYKNGKTSA